MELPIELDLDGGFAAPLPGEEDPPRELPSDEDSYFDFEVGEQGHERGNLSAKFSASGANEVPRDGTGRSEMSQVETGDEQQNPVPPKYVSEVYSLTHIVTKIIASNLADYPPGVSVLDHPSCNWSNSSSEMARMSKLFSLSAFSASINGTE